VGTTTHLVMCRALLWAHPHVRGDDNSRSFRRNGSHGSPPRAWGRRPQIEAVIGHRRLTPTCVGTTS